MSNAMCSGAKSFGAKSFSAKSFGAKSFGAKSFSVMSFGAMSALIRDCDLVQRSQINGTIPDDQHVEIPMSQQSALGSHGHDMHPQEFVRLAGCQDASARDKQAADLHHEDAQQASP
jgi:hypothetical protein